MRARSRFSFRAHFFSFVAQGRSQRFAQHRMATLPEEIARRRAFAIIAHPDAGKTTLTEKILLYGGAIQLAGHVRARKDRRSTRSDWMTMERERGISITTAALQFEYNGFVLNLLDTPGHEDFSEDTYRTLMAVDAAVMLLDGAKGVEPQTIKLFHVCRERNIPIVTFINKMDMPARDPFSLLDEVEKVLGITAVPLTWPMGSGPDFRGFFDLRDNTVHRFERTKGGQHKAPESMTGIDDPELVSLMGEELYSVFHEGVELASGALPAFDVDVFRAGNMTPVFFGSAVTNFGVQLFLDRFIQLAPKPAVIPLLSGGMLDPESKEFSAFVFKLQANMNQKHRDRVAFVRITSGIFERGMAVTVPRLEKQVKLSSPVSFFGQERSTVDIAYPGDIIGLINPGTYHIGDTLCTGTPPAFRPLPRFAPEMFSRLVPTDTEKLKSFRKGVEQLAEEGVVQVFTGRDGNPVLGAVGTLQFEVFRFRLEDEYNAPCRLEALPFECSRWIRAEDAGKFSAYDMILKDEKNRPIVLFKSDFRMRSFQQTNPDVPLFEHPQSVD
ncbi:MAG: peptide chain release factor 3 [Spirochaetia bacterium]|nr:peptide chain release factor 3 [Spirochaetia bacterium]